MHGGANRAGVTMSARHYIIRAMNRAEVMARLKAAEPALRARGVASLYLCGSYARDEARPDSDIDIMVDLQSWKGMDLSSYLAPYRVLEAQFPNVEIGYGTRDELVSHYHPYIEQSAIRVF